jgi:RHS repeat-associated protein
MTTAENQVSKVTRTYDNARRLLIDVQDLKDTGISSHTVSYTYRADSKVVEVATGTYDFLFNYDAMARLEKIQGASDSSTDYQYYYDAASNVTKRIVWFNGASATFTYDNLNRASERDINVPTSQIPRGWFSKEHYGYDVMNRLTNVLRDEDVKTDTFSYYLDGEMSAAHYANSARNVTYNLDNGGNRTSVTDGTTKFYTPTNINLYSVIGGAALTYTGGHALSAYNGESYSSIAGQQLCQATSGANTLQLYYDALGRGVKRKLNGVSNYYIFDGEHWITEYNSSDVNSGSTVYGRGMDEFIARGDLTQGYFYFPDRNGNMSVVLNGSGGVMESYRYDAFGLPTIYGPTGTVLGATAIGNRFMFTGREWRNLFGFYEYRARGYDPSLGRFLSEDPKGFDAGDYNLNRYVSNDPLDKTDPMGLDAWLTLNRDYVDPTSGEKQRNAAGTLSVFEGPTFRNARFQFSTRANENGYEPGTNGLYAGTYRILPRTDYQKWDHFKNGTPAVTALGESNPGDAGHGYHNVYIHPKGADSSKSDSRGCITVCGEAANQIKQVMDRNENTTLTIIFPVRVMVTGSLIPKIIPVAVPVKEGN